MREDHGAARKRDGDRGTELDLEVTVAATASGRKGSCCVSADQGSRTEALDLRA